MTPTADRTCRRCAAPIEWFKRADSIYCSKSCRTVAAKERKRWATRPALGSLDSTGDGHARVV